MTWLDCWNGWNMCNLWHICSQRAVKNGYNSSYRSVVQSRQFFLFSWKVISDASWLDESLMRCTPVTRVDWARHWRRLLVTRLDWACHWWRSLVTRLDWARHWWRSLVTCLNWARHWRRSLVAHVYASLVCSHQRRNKSDVCFLRH
jgi:hypothetical protein